jgi:hypothetical protein
VTAVVALDVVTHAFAFGTLCLSSIDSATEIIADLIAKRTVIVQNPHNGLLAVDPTVAPDIAAIITKIQNCIIYLTPFGTFTLISSPVHLATCFLYSV